MHYSQSSSRSPTVFFAMWPMKRLSKHLRHHPDLFKRFWMVKTGIWNTRMSQEWNRILSPDDLWQIGIKPGPHSSFWWQWTIHVDRKIWGCSEIIWNRLYGRFYNIKRGHELHFFIIILLFSLRFTSDVSVILCQKKLLSCFWPSLQNGCIQDSQVNTHCYNWLTVLLIKITGGRCCNVLWKQCGSFWLKNV